MTKKPVMVGTDLTHEDVRREDGALATFPCKVKPGRVLIDGAGLAADRSAA